MDKFRRSLLLVIVALLSACAGAPARQPAQAPTATAQAGRGGTVAMPDSFSAAVAANILGAGGNAVDAAVAGAFSLAVTYPEAGNLGGGGFMLAWIDGAATFLDYREAAPAAATRDMYLDAAGNVIDDLSLTGHRAVAYPVRRGPVGGAQQVWQVILGAVVAPAVRCRSGFRRSALLAERAAAEEARFAGTNFVAHFGTLQAGETFRQPTLADPARIQKGGRRLLPRADRRPGRRRDAAGGGLITRERPAAYRPTWREPSAHATAASHVSACRPPARAACAAAVAGHDRRAG